LFTAKTAQLRAKRRLTAGTFSGLTTVMQAVVAGLMVFVLSIVTGFATMIPKLVSAGDAMQQAPSMSIGMANFSPSDLQFLTSMTIFMIVALAFVSAAAIILCDGGYKPKAALYLAMTIFISGVSMIVVPPMVAGILKV
jgi:archaellum biogenesis protein FlaJ (TadC family)